MMIFIKEGLVLYATPKNGSTALAHALGSRADIWMKNHSVAKHTTFGMYRGLLERYVLFLSSELPETIASFREPVSWLGSWYRYRKRPTMRNVDNSTAEVSFNQFVESYLMEKQPVYARIGSQGRFVSDKRGLMGVDRLFRYDNFAGMTDFLSARLKTNVIPTKMNVSPTENLEISPELLREYQNKYSIDFDIYDSIGVAKASSD